MTQYYLYEYIMTSGERLFYFFIVRNLVFFTQTGEQHRYLSNEMNEIRLLLPYLNSPMLYMRIHNTCNTLLSFLFYLKVIQ